jgi:hypothetical protein
MRRRRHPRTLVGELRTFEVRDRRSAIIYGLAAFALATFIPGDIVSSPLLGGIELLLFVVLLLVTAYYGLSWGIWRGMRKMEEDE